MSPLRRVHVLVEGRVQGVGFRMFTRTLARRLGVAGYVRNLPDGRVEAVAEGDPKAVETFLKGLRAGPRRARVDRLDVRDQPPTSEFASFDIRY